MKKPSESEQNREVGTVEHLIGLGESSTRKSYYPELQRKLEELEQEKDRYKWLFENALHGIFQAAPAGAITAANPAIATLCGYRTPAELCRQVRDIGRQLFRYPEHYRLALEQLQTAGRLLGFETELRTGDGGYVQVSMNMLLKQETDGPVIEAFVQDITERKQAQMALKRMNVELEQRVQTRTRELLQANVQLRREIAERKQIEQALKQAKQEAEQANISKDKYLAAASHDLLQPLNAARLLVATLQERDLHYDNQALVERIHLALEGAEDLLSDLLDIAKLDANAVTAEFTHLETRHLLESLSAEFEPVARNAGLDLKVQLCNLTIRSDNRLLLRILRNFLSNAIRYTQQGKILLGCRRRGERLRIEVWDTGAGIPADKLRDIFQEFHQLNQHQARKGVGLGLAIVDRIAGILDHRIDVRSQEGKGSVFSIEVPLGEPQQQTAHARSIPLPTSAQNPLQDRRILVIDNEEDVQVSMSALLQQWGCEVKTCASADEARQAYPQPDSLPEVILADYHLDSQATGIEAIQTLHAHFHTAIPAAIITADRSDELLREFKARKLPVLNKPVKALKLRALLTHLLAD